MSTEKHQQADDASDVVTVSDVIGVGEQAHRVVTVGPWKFTAWVGRGEEEPRISDVDLGERLGYQRPRKLRDLIDRYHDTEILNDFDICPTTGRSGDHLRRGRPGRRYFLTEAAALFVAAKSETPTAVALTKEMIRAYMLARRGLLPQRLDLEAVQGVLHQAVVNATAPLAARLSEQAQDIARLHHALDQHAGVMAANAAQVSSVLLTVAAQTKKMCDYMAEQNGVISGLQTDRLKADITWLSQAWVALGLAKTEGSVRSARREIMNELLGKDWGGAGQRLASMPAALFPIVRARLDAMRAKAERALVRRGKPKPVPKKQPGLYDKN